MVVIGAGPGGLAVAASLREVGVDALVVDRADAVGSSWRRHYDRLHLHTPRRWSALPGLPIPRRYGRWVSRDDVVAYLEQYAAHHRVALRLGTAVERVDRADGSAPDGTRWIVRLADGSTFYPDQVLSRMEALATYTKNAAFAAFEEKEKGTLEVGKLADVTVLSRDILSVPEEEIKQAQVLYTIVGGKVAYEKK